MDDINAKLPEQLPGDPTSYKSMDTVPDPHQVMHYPTEFLNSLAPSGLPPHNLVVVKKVPNKLYMVSSEVTNGNIPYGDTFYISSLFCITSISNKRSHIVVTWNVTYVKSTFGFIKSLIEKNTDAGLVDHYKSLAEKLKEHANTPKSSGKLRSAEPNAEFKPKIAVQRAPQGVPKSAGVPYYASSSIFGIGANTVLIIMIIVMLSVVVVNVMLYSQLKALEYKSTQQDIYGDLFDFNKIGGSYPTSDNDWLKLFYQQKYLHNQEMEKMSDVVTVTAQMVEQKIVDYKLIAIAW
ncbi:PREDICTED: GRAM domain-containing protein 1B-like [Priapulus caudatus]|uniref:GRAM domain-containing protein 1B-like n=1 Tax=Priapulus caudatus TaxID=37621 RepID=A0ABM1F0K6_PRICU|nr:PREDICTED: GRAM domain-containing protein 1B-like [Priapulus caudatus]